MTQKRINKALAEAGIASRRSCEEWILSGRVAVNGRIVKTLATIVDTDVDKVSVDNKIVSLHIQKLYLVLNKPLGYICSSRRVNPKDKIVLELFSSIPQRLFTVGRLDKDTRGLIIVTNDGNFAQKVIHPSAKVTKEYLVKTTQEVTSEHLIQMSKGIIIENSFIKPVKVVKVRKGTFKIVVAEGKKREVRLIAQAAGLKIESLTRIRIGHLQLGSLPIGLWRHMTELEKQGFLQNKRALN